MTRSLFRALAAPLALLAAWAASSAPASAAPCASNCLQPGDHRIAIWSGGLLRSFLVHVPESYTGRDDVPLLLDLHGFSSYAADERQWSGQLRESDRRGFIAVWPEGMALSWNAYGCCFLGNALLVDDVAFLRSVIVEMKRRTHIDDDRVYVTGISNGGGMAQRMACEAADVVTAVVSISFPLNSDQCRPARPVSVTAIAATDDGTINYYGNSPVWPLPATLLGVPLGIQGARESLAAWKRLDGCSDELTRIQLKDDVRVEEYRDCRGGTRAGLVTIVGGTHVLYSGYVGLGYSGDYVAPIDVAEYMWTTVFDR
ncbi:PHB depolymerase family esterase [Sphingopyxis sp.]|uniref:alpha/beta hydrolase family esterase n=1 Tax=Sphingopyxis sp. TaxID=1908224 RepID=UPI002D78D03D|nr:PHB depolymerase family esterase [Sphingopyxis sp.]HET6524469.1 PHB depolymerase family esterase [Sphingopyxis sp.]